MRRMSEADRWRGSRGGAGRGEEREAEREEEQRKTETREERERENARSHLVGGRCEARQHQSEPNFSLLAPSQTEIAMATHMHIFMLTHSAV